MVLVLLGPTLSWANKTKTFGFAWSVVYCCFCDTSVPGGVSTKNASVAGNGSYIVWPWWPSP